MVIKLPKRKSYFVPAGAHVGTCTQYFRLEGIGKRDEEEEGALRIMFKLDPVDEGVDYYCGKNIPMSQLPELLDEWLGLKVGPSFEADILLGRRARLEIVNNPPKGNYQEGFRDIISIRPGSEEREQDDNAGPEQTEETEAVSPNQKKPKRQSKPRKRRTKKS